MSIRNVSTIICSEDMTLCLSTDGTVFSVGHSSFGENGYEEEVVFPPKIIPLLVNIKSVDSSGNHSACLDYDGNVFTFGINMCGQLGICNPFHLISTHIPQKVNLPPCIQISCGRFCTMCVTEDGLVYLFGNTIGNQDECFYLPTIIEYLQDVQFIECVERYAFCKTKNNEIYCWGSNDCGQLGLGNLDLQITPVQCTSLLNEDIVDIKCSTNHTLALNSKGEVLSCGGDSYRQTENTKLSLFTKIEDLPEIIRIECGAYHSMCIDINNNLYIFGGNGQLRRETRNQFCRAFGKIEDLSGIRIEHEDNQSMHITFDNHLYVFDRNECNEIGLETLDEIRTKIISSIGHIDKPKKQPSLSNIIDISKGGNHCFVKTSNNEIYAFGNNKYSQLGIETELEKQLLPIRVFQDNEDIWRSNFKSMAKSARFTSNIRPVAKVY